MSNERTFRAGKTAREHKSGVHENRFRNQEARRIWDNEPRSSNSTFPSLSCNGKKNRSRITGKGGKTIFLK